MIRQDVLRNVKNLMALLIAVIVTFAAGAQPSRRTQRLFDEARQFHAMNDFKSAIETGERILEIEPSFVQAHLLLADVYFDMKSPSKEAFHLEKAMELSSEPLILSRLGDAYFSLGNYRNALKLYRLYADHKGVGEKSKMDAARKIENSLFAIEAIQNPVDFDPVPLPGTINTEADEYWPSLSIDQQQLIFTRLIKTPGLQPQEDFYSSEFIGNEWQPARAVAEINTHENEGAQTLSADGRILFFTACNRRGGAGSCDIYYSFKEDDKWSIPLNAGTELNTAFWEAQPSFSSDGRFLYFASNRPGGKGGRDIWKAEFLGAGNNGYLKWRKPVNLGDSINTPGNETSPFIHAGNRDFYFSSDYHTGMGGYDLFVSRITQDSIYSAPRNLGYPVNTNNDEQGLYISADGLTAFFSSSRDSVHGVDIYSFALDESIRPQPATYVKAVVSDSETGTPVQAEIDLVNLSDLDQAARKESTNIDGVLLITIPAGADYAFSVSRDGYLFYSTSFNLQESRNVYDPYLLDIALTPVKVGAEMNLYNIYFETDSFSILPESEPELLKLTEFLQNNSRLKVEVQGHTDNTGTAAGNLALSEKRAQSVVEYLKTKGIAQERLEWEGFGESKPVAGNDSEEGRRLNRRTTIKILGNK
jgi:outer membrane protein OmpA-like peptidoglycan-associated protein/Tol biopolymer transport system component